MRRANPIVSRSPAKAGRYVAGLHRPSEAARRSVRLQPDLRALLLLLAVLAPSCNRTPPLATTHESPEALASAVLDAVADGDRERLEALALDESEFRDHVWPSLPAAREERNLPFSYVWGDLRQKSSQSLDATLAGHGGQRYELEQVDFEGVTDYGPYRVHRRASFVVRGGTVTSPLRLCGSMIEKDGRWKVFSYVVDD